MEFLKKLFQFLFVIALLPFVCMAVYHLPSHMVAYPTDVVKLFLGGGVAFVAIYLFLYQCREIQTAGQSMIGRIFSFSPAVQVVMMKILSCYLLLSVLLFFLISRGFGLTHYNPQLMFLMGFFFAMHNVLTAVEMQEEDGSKILKIGYLSSFIVVLLVNIVILIFLFDAIKGQFTFLEYAEKVIESGSYYIIWVIDHLPFLNKN